MKNAIFTIITFLFLLTLGACEVHNYPKEEIVWHTGAPNAIVVTDNYYYEPYEYCYELKHEDCCVYYDYYNDETCEITECYHYITQEWYEGELCWYE